MFGNPAHSQTFNTQKSAEHKSKLTKLLSVNLRYRSTSIACPSFFIFIIKAVV